MHREKSDVLIAYATRQGQTRRICEHLAEALQKRGIAVNVRDVSEGERGLEIEDYRACILAAPLHVGRFPKEMQRFVERHRVILKKRASAFLSVSLAQAAAEDKSISEEKRSEATQQVAKTMVTFFDKVQWYPDRVASVAGALMSSEYNLFERWMMKRIAKTAGMATDTSRDHSYTDWDTLDRFADEFASTLQPGAHPGAF